MTRSPAEYPHPPIYEDLIRERGDVVAAAQIAAAHTENQATQLLGPAEPAHWDEPTGHQQQHQQQQLPSAFG